MGAILLPSRFNQQPQHAAQLDMSLPVLAGLALAVNAGDAFYDAVRQREATQNGISRRAGGAGTGFHAASNSSVGAQFAASPMSTSDGAGTGDFTYLVFANPAASATREFFVCSQSGSQEFYFGANFDTGLGAQSGYINAQTNVGGASGVSVAAAADGQPHLYAYARQGTTGRLFVDGILGASGTVSNAQMWASNSSDYIGGYSGAGWGISNDVFLVLGWNRALSDAEVQQLSQDPWQIFKAPPRRLWYAAGGAVNVTGTLAETLTGTSMASSGTTINAGTLALTLGGAIMSGVGSVGSAPSGAFTSTLAGCAMAGAGQIIVLGTLSSSLADVTISSTGAVNNRGALASSLDGASMTAAGTVAPNAIGTLASTLDGATMAAYGYNGVPPVLAGFFHRLPKNPRHVQRLP